MALVACDVIREEDRYLPVGPKARQSRALLVEFTGFKCMNCPTAAAEAHALLEEYADTLVVVEVHPSQNGFCTTDKPEWDYSSPVGDAIYAQFGGVSSTPLPTGVLNLSGTMMDYVAWQMAVDNAVTQPSMGKIQVARLEVADRHMSLDYQVVAADRQDMQVRFWLTEDSIVGPQRMPDGSTNMEYVRNHVLRDEMYAGAAEANATVQYDVPDAVHAQSVRLEKCHVVAILANKQGRVVDVCELTL